MQARQKVIMSTYPSCLEQQALHLVYSPTNTRATSTSATPPAPVPHPQASAAAAIAAPTSAIPPSAMPGIAKSSSAVPISDVPPNATLLSRARPRSGHNQRLCQLLQGLIFLLELSCKRLIGEPMLCRPSHLICHRFFSQVHICCRVRLSPLPAMLQQFRWVVLCCLLPLLCARKLNNCTQKREKAAQYNPPKLLQQCWKRTQPDSAAYMGLAGELVAHEVRRPAQYGLTDEEFARKVQQEDSEMRP